MLRFIGYDCLKKNNFDYFFFFLLCQKRMGDIMHAILIGDSAVGKSTIFSRLSTSTFVQSIDSTIGAILIRYINNDYKININLWDTAGQERFFSLLPSYIRKGEIIIIVLDPIKNLETQILKYLKLLLKSELSPLLTDILFVVNKCDLLDENELDNVRNGCVKIVRNFYFNFLTENRYNFDRIIEGLLDDQTRSNFIMTSAKTGYGFDSFNEKLSSYKSGSYEKNKYSYEFNTDKKCMC